MFFDLKSPQPYAPAVIAAAFRAILCALVNAFATLSPRYLDPNPDPHAHLVTPFTLYLQRTFVRFTRLIARVEAGTLTPPKPRAKRARAETPRKTPRLRLPRGKAWVIRALPWRAITQATDLTTLLARPEVAAIVTAHPQAQRLLRPLCHMLGIAPICVPKRPPHPPKPRPRKPRRLTRTQREAILWYPNSEGKPMKLLPKRLPRD